MTSITATKPTHPWTRHIRVSSVPGPRDALAEGMVPDLLSAFARLGHHVDEIPTPETDVVLTTARFGEPLEWREATFFSLRRTYGLVHQPTLYTIVHAGREEFERLLARFESALDKEPPDPRDYEFPGLSPTAYHVLVEQGRRGGPILALERLVQAQAMSIRVLLVVGDERAEDIYHFDLVGAYPTSEGATLDEVYEDTARRIATTVSTREVTAHEVVGETVPQSLWQTLETPGAM
ncbi:MAG TPA: hypothetical protein VD769_04700, partial [Gaiellaceae bacterium]|nr:hypothetical protein [Gaiellaceae bacterium]